ncbi:hypothetical protein CK203_064556 [Vitis vinifera]|uniref:Uncharacterized protein n=1 Tax=Vitis vinifera TaxID=29760 RepID=A0A438FSZ3_VITVI|nr:hypothetical protein CK203_064556 [Vitis vinifera]
MASAKSRFGCENGPSLRNKFRSPTLPSAKISQLRKHLLAHECHFAAQVFRSCETPLWHTSAISQHNNPISQLRNGLRNVRRPKKEQPSIFSLSPEPRPHAPPPISAGPPWQEPEELSPPPRQAVRGFHQRPLSKAPHPSLRDHCDPTSIQEAPRSPPVRRYHTRASSQPPKKKAKVSEPALIDLSEPEEPAIEPQPS